MATAFDWRSRLQGSLTRFTNWAGEEPCGAGLILFRAEDEARGMAPTRLIDEALEHFGHRGDGSIVGCHEWHTYHARHGVLMPSFLRLAEPTRTDEKVRWTPGVIFEWGDARALSRVGAEADSVLPAMHAAIRAGATALHQLPGWGPASGVSFWAVLCMEYALARPIALDLVTKDIRRHLEPKETIDFVNGSDVDWEPITTEGTTLELSGHAFNREPVAYWELSNLCRASEAMLSDILSNASDRQSLKPIDDPGNVPPLTTPDRLEDSCTLALTVNQSRVLQTMDMFDPSRPAFLPDIAEEMNADWRLSVRTIGTIVQKLVELRLAERLEGGRSGARLTMAGRRLAKKIAD